jgi:hypothetical protein
VPLSSHTFCCSFHCLDLIKTRPSHLQVPLLFKELTKPCDKGGFGVQLGKKPQGSLEQPKVQLVATKLRTALDTYMFARSPRWNDFRQECDELHSLLHSKVEAMKADATSQAERRNANVTKSARMKPSFVPPSLEGTAPKYAALEALLLPMDDYAVLALPEEECLKLAPLSDEAASGKDPDANRRKHLERWRKDMAFETFAIETIEATWGSQRKLSLFVWRAPIDVMVRTSPACMAKHDAAVAHIERQLVVICGRYARQQFVSEYSSITGLSKPMLRNMHALLSSDGQAPHSSAESDIQLRCVEFVASRGCVEHWPDLRALNGNDGSKYELFWAEGDKYLAELETLASGNRHGQQRSLQQPLSVPDFTRQVARRLREAGKADVPIPDANWVGFQFHPRRPESDVARRYTGRWAIKLQVPC